MGRIGCIEEGRPYIVPISYAFDNGYIYGHSIEGLKIKIMRNNPRVCFQVDSIENMTNWRSVIAWGEFEEMKNEDEYEFGMRILNNRLAPFVTSNAVRPHNDNDKNVLNYVVKGEKILVFRIKILEQSGRFENSNL
ncbi:pyridoxamine 5'-phosphate oxidase family protein [Algoriphagus persicinus]|uniref:pyridoxamine 5'-phosphate oxidase family protein n=1 Tax=Algoriphagus persicinus TaxID=3108754 RepID=UPI002B3ABDA4|nr:pyridoxamine 5'-phosphate oxidase family protein [Algoriphagus sp. E1-3-M2]MEB2785258.1 pyridoxamine 5'-phosphate oxidase family protein [Algoriphagus sp. E1-3-M2]